MLNPLETANRHLVNPIPPQEQKEMAVTFNITGSYGYVYIPIGDYNSEPQSHNIRIDWGDGQATEVEAGVEIAKNITSHKYSTDKGYVTVRITSEDGILPEWYSIATSNYWVGTKYYSSYFAEWIARYETPLLRIENTDRFTLGGTSCKLEYMDGYLLKNNGHVTNFKPYLNNYEKTNSETKEGETFKLDRNILLDLPNLQTIYAWESLICGEQNFDKDSLFDGCPNLENAEMNVNYSNFYFPDKRFPNIFRKSTKLLFTGRNASSASKTYPNRATDPWILDQIHTIPEDMFRNCPKIQKMGGLFSGQCQNLQTAGISFTKGGFFAENWAPEEMVRVDSMFAITSSNSINTGNATDFANTVKEVSNNNYWAKGCFYGHNSMEGYSTIASTFRTTPY